MKALKRHLGLILTTLLLCSPLFSIPAFADEEEEIEINEGVSEEEVISAGEVFEEEEVELDDKTVRSAYLILQLQTRLSQKIGEYNQIETQMDSAREALLEIRESINSLNDQLTNLDGLIGESEKKINSVTSQLTKGELELAKLMEELEMRELQIEDQEAVIGKLMTILYVKKNTYYDSSDDLNTLKLLLADGNVSDTMQDLVYLNLIEQTGKDILGALQENQGDMFVKKLDVEEKTDLLRSLDNELWGENQNLIAEKSGKEMLLQETQGKEDIYQELLILSKKNQEEVEDEIGSLRDNIDLLDDKIAYATSELTDEQMEQIFQIKAESLVDNGVVGSAEFLDLSWPIEPQRGLSAYFVDSGYRAVFGVSHNAIDIRTPHGSPIFAPADGVVYKVKYDDESLDYAYVMLAHRKGVVTVYGHVSAVGVFEGDYVERGDIIGMSGGTPGSTGAGFRTTGPHLHFEVWQDGILVDPLDYLNLSHIPMETLRDDYLERFQNELANEISEIENTLKVLQKDG